MKTLSLSEAKMKLSALIELVQSIDEEFLITKNGKPAAVLLNPEELESLRETWTIQSDEDFKKEIKKGLKELAVGKAKLYSLEELFD